MVCLLGLILLLLLLVGCQLGIQGPSFSLQLLQLLPELGQVGFKDRLQALGAVTHLQLLQQVPLGL